MADDDLSEQARLLALATYGDPNDMPSPERLTAAMSRLDDEVEALAQAAMVTAPDFDEIERACAALGSAASAQAEAERTADALSADRIQLLETSLEFHDRHGTQPCPVCAEGTLDEAWVGRARAALSAEHDAANALRVARSAAHRARQILVALVRAADPRADYQPFSALPVDDDMSLAEHVRLALPGLRTAYPALREQAATELEIAREAQKWLQTFDTR